MIGSVRRRLSYSSEKRLEGDALIRAQNGAFKDVSESVVLMGKAITGKGCLSKVNLDLLMEGGMLEIYDEHHVTPVLKEELKMHLLVQRMYSDNEKKLLFRVESETPSTLTRKFAELFYAVGFDTLDISVRTTENAAAMVSADVSLLSAAMGNATVEQKREGNQKSRYEVKSPSNYAPSESSAKNYDAVVAELYGLSHEIEATRISYEVFKNGGLEGTLKSRQGKFSVHISILSDFLGGAGAGADGVNAKLSGKRSRFTEIVLDITVTYLSDKHVGLLMAREAVERKRKQDSESVEQAFREANEALEKEQRALEAVRMFEQSEEEAKEAMMYAFATFQAEMKLILEAFPKSLIPYLPFWSTDSNKDIYMAGFRGAGKSSLCLGCKMVVTGEWENLDKAARAVRVPFDHAEGSVERDSVKLKFKTANPDLINAQLVDITGTVRALAGFVEGAPNQRLALVVPVNELVDVHGDELVIAGDFRSVIQALPAYKSASAIILTKWDELFYKSSTEEQLLENVDRFWREHHGIVDPVTEMVEQQLKSNDLNHHARVFGVRTPIRNDPNRTFKARYQMFMGHKAVLLHLMKVMG